jgi:hypothetical protein
LKRISDFFYRFSTGWIALIGTVIFVAFSVMALPTQSAQTETYSHGLGSPDTTLFYNSKTIIGMAEAYGEEGRAAYLQARWTFDLAFPLVYTFFMITSISFLFARCSWNSSRIRLLNLAPLAALVFDLAENTSASVVMAAFPQQHTWGQFLAPIFTPIKWFFVTFSLLLVLLGLVSWIIKGITNKSKK